MTMMSSATKMKTLSSHERYMPEWDYDVGVPDIASSMNDSN